MPNTAASPSAPKAGPHPRRDQSGIDAAVKAASRCGNSGVSWGIDFTDLAHNRRHQSAGGKVVGALVRC